MGNGPTLYRAADHQCFKTALVVKGKDNPSSKFDLLEVVGEVPRDKLTYDPNGPDFTDNGKSGVLGECNNGD